MNKNFIENINLYKFQQTDSTNLRARGYILSGGHLPALFVADEQTAGRGRRGKNFYSPKDSGLYMSLALSVSDPFKNFDLLTVSVSVALIKTLLPLTKKGLSIKWVNDILADGEKAAGILCEFVTNPEKRFNDAVVIGIGVNLSTSVFPDSIEQAVTSLEIYDVNNLSLAKDIAINIFKVLECDKAEILKTYREYSAVIGQEIYYFLNGKRIDAICLDIDENGGLVVGHTDQKKVTLTSGEITLRIKSH